MINELIDLTIQIQQIPAPTFDESIRGQFIKQTFTATPGKLSEIQTDHAGNVLACIKGSGTGKPLVISAHLDTVFPKETNLAVHYEEGKIFGPGIGDNSLGVAGLFGIVWELQKRSIILPGDIWFTANTCEEGLGNLRGMKEIVNRFGADPVAYLVLEGMALGNIYHRGAGVQRYKINIQTEGGHSWTDYGKPSAINELSEMINKITGIKLPSKPHSTLNIGRISGGTSINTIASNAWMELDLRSEDPASLQELDSRVSIIVNKCRKKGFEIDINSIGQRPAGEISLDHKIIRLAENCLLEQGIQPEFTIGSTDANYPLSLGYPALVLGLSTGGKAHTIHEFIETSPLKQGIEHIIQFISRVWQ
ncbi:MAG: M20/M25/M40 family metallo-hydrolase [Chloroflexota bacterium]